MPRGRVVKLAAIATAAGAFSALFGVGGGILFVPALTLFLDQSQLHAESTSLLAIVPVALVGAWRQRRYGNVRLGDGVVLGMLSPLGVVVGVLVSNAVPERALELGFAALLILVAVQLARRALRPARGRQGERGEAASRGG